MLHKLRRINKTLNTGASKRFKLHTRAGRLGEFCLVQACLCFNFCADPRVPCYVWQKAAKTGLPGTGLVQADVLMADGHKTLRSLHSPGVAMCRGEQLVMRWHMGHQIIITRVLWHYSFYLLVNLITANSSLKADQAFKSIWIKEKISSIALSRCFIGQVWRYSAECVPLFSLHLLLFTFRLRNVMNVNMLIPRQALTAQWQDTPRPRNVR